MSIYIYKYIYMHNPNMIVPKLPIRAQNRCVELFRGVYILACNCVIPLM